MNILDKKYDAKIKELTLIHNITQHYILDCAQAEIIGSLFGVRHFVIAAVLAAYINGVDI